jgi:hypothetical protein
MISYNRQIHHHLFNLLKLSITEWQTTTCPTMPGFLHLSFQYLFQRQLQIGWNQVIQGRLVKAWSTLPNQPDIDDQTITYMIKQILSEIYSWTIRCNRNHGTDSTTKRQRAMVRLQPQLQEIYNKNDIPCNTESHIFKLSFSSDTMKLPTSTLE